MKRLCIICLSLFLCFAFSACSAESKEYRAAQKALQNQDYQAAMEGFQSLGSYKDSYELLRQAQKGYAEEALENKDYETAIPYLEMLVGYENGADLLKQAKVKYAESMIKDIVENDDGITDRSDVDKLFEVCKDFSHSDFTNLNYESDFETILCEFINETSRKLKWEEMLDLLRDGKFLLDESTIHECIVICGRWGCIPCAEEYIKDLLRNPQSYKRNGGSVSSVRDHNGYYSVTVTLDYGAQNGFGGMVRTEENYLVDFVPDFEQITIDFSCLGNATDFRYNIAEGLRH